MAEQVFTVEKGVTLAAGLKWFPIKGNSSKERSEQTKAIIGRLGTDLTIELKNPFQTGFIQSMDGYKSGMYSMAAVVAENVRKTIKRSTFQCAFQLEGNLWGYVAVYQEMILPSSSAFRNDFIGSENEVREHFIGVSDKMPWEAQICPAHWHVPDTMSVSASDLIPRKKNGKVDLQRQHRLKKVQTTSDKAKALLLLFLVVLIACGSYWWWQNEQDKKAEALRQQQIAAAKKKQDSRPWKKIPTAFEFVHKCQESFNRLPNLFPQGWQFHSAVCTNEAISFVWNREVDGLAGQMQKAQPEAKISPSGNTAELILPLKMETGQDDKVGPLEERRLEMMDVAMRDGIPLKFTDKASKEKTKKTKKSASAKTSPKDNNSKTATFVIKDMTVLPFSAVDALDGPGMRINVMQINMKDGIFNWSLEGKQYGK